MTDPHLPIRKELIPELQERFTALGYPPGACLYRVTIDDLLTVLSPRLAQTPVALSEADLEAMLDQVTDYLNSEGMPWREVIDLALDDSWKSLTQPEETR